MSYYIWWLDQSQSESIEEAEASNLPEYIQSEFRSRHGRPGRGRLWNNFDEKVEVNPWPETALARYLAEDSGGIVILTEDFEHVKNLPGTVTDTYLNRVFA